MRSLYLITGIFLISFLTRAYAADLGAETPACRPFLLHAGAAPPYRWEKLPKPKKENAADEEKIVKKIAGLPGYGSFLNAYLPWKEEQKSLSISKRVQRLECIYFYAKQDTDGDGIPDWQAVVDRRPSAVLYPQDEDIDGDGTSNLLDPAPFDGKKKRKLRRHSYPPGFGRERAAEKDNGWIRNPCR